MECRSRREHAGRRRRLRVQRFDSGHTRHGDWWSGLVWMRDNPDEDAGHQGERNKR